MDLNIRIRQLIDAKEKNPSAFSNEGLADAVINYTECSDFDISNSDIESGLKKLYQYAGINEFSYDKSCIISNSVNGKIAKHLSDNIHIYCFDNDYYCSMASQIVNHEKNKMDKIEFIFSDISQFFTFQNNKNFIADFVITCPQANQNTYKHLDYEMKYRMMTPHQYYTVRALEFLQSGGIVCSILPSASVDSVVNQVLKYDSPVQVLGNINFTRGYTFLYLKKI